MATELLSSRLLFRQEPLAECLNDDSKQLLRLHWAEVAPHQDLALDPDYGAYERLEQAGALRCYIIRQDGVIVGYAVFIVTQDMKYRSHRVAIQELLYLLPEFRGKMLGARFLLWCDEQLRREGVTLVRQCVEQTYDFGSLLERVGYHLEQRVYVKRLDKE